MANPTVAQIEDSAAWLTAATQHGLANVKPPRWNVEQVVFALLGLYGGPIQHDKVHPNPVVAAQLAAARGHWLRHFHPEAQFAVPSDGYVQALAEDLNTVQEVATSSGMVKFAGFGAVTSDVAVQAAKDFWAQKALAAQGGPALYVIASAYKNGAWSVTLASASQPGLQLLTVVNDAGKVVSHAGRSDGSVTAPSHNAQAYQPTSLPSTHTGVPSHNTQQSLSVDPSTPSTEPVATGTDAVGPQHNDAPPPPPAGALSTGAKVGVGAGLLGAAFLAWKLTN